MTRYIDADTLYMNLVKMKDFGELTAKKAIRAVENEPTVDLRKVTQDYASYTTIDAVPVVLIESRINGLKKMLIDIDSDDVDNIWALRTEIDTLTELLEMWAERKEE